MEVCEWKCNRCGKKEVVCEYEYNTRKCSCGYWMEWRILTPAAVLSSTRILKKNMKNLL